jgi:hypothetical protein
MTQLTGHHTDPFIRSARRLRRQADQMNPIVAQAFRRRASELELETWLRRLADPSVERSALELSVA